MTLPSHTALSIMCVAYLLGATLLPNTGYSQTPTTPTATPATDITLAHTDTPAPNSLKDPSETSPQNPVPSSLTTPKDPTIDPKATPEQNPVTPTTTPSTDAGISMAGTAPTSAAMSTTSPKPADTASTKPADTASTKPEGAASTKPADTASTKPEGAASTDATKPQSSPTTTPPAPCCADKPKDGATEQKTPETPLQDTERATQFFSDKINFMTNIHGLKKVVDGIDKDILIVDLRDEEAFKKGHVPGAINMPWDQFNGFIGAETEFPQLNKSQMTYVYCYEHLCNLGAKAARKFTSLGYPTKEVEGGFDEWKKNKNKIEHTTRSSHATATPSAPVPVPTTTNPKEESAKTDTPPVKA